MLSKIQWTDRSDWNPIRGCTRVSDGCVNCYAESIAARFSDPGQPFHGFAKRTPHGPRWTGKVELIESRLALPLRWRKPARIFVNSAFDLFHESIPDEWIDRVFAVMALAPQHTFQCLTKRSKRMRDYMSALTFARVIVASDGMPAARGTITVDNIWKKSPASGLLPHVWLGVSAEDQARADERVPDLLATPAAVRFVSAEPLLGNVRIDRVEIRPDSRDEKGHLKRAGIRVNALTGRSCESGMPYQSLWDGNGDAPTTPPPRLDWIIVGGESGPGARPMRVEWVRAIVDQCKAAGAACFVKQFGPRPIMDKSDAVQAVALGAGWEGRAGHVSGIVSLRDRKGGDLIEWPVDLRVQQFPLEAAGE